MKRFLSMALALALVLTSLMVPAYADEATGEEPAVTTVAVDITSITDGETFAAGGNVKLAADASGIEGVSHIDFYANGAKLPGTIVGNTGEFVWYGLAEGVYDITTKVTYNGEPAATAWGNETVRILVVPANTSKITRIWPDGGALTGDNNAVMSTDYAMFGTESLKVIPGASQTTLRFDRTSKIARTFTHIVVDVYSPETIEGLTVASNTPAAGLNRTGARMVDNASTRAYNASNDGNFVIEKGFNRFRTQNCDYSGSGSIDFLDWITFGFGLAPEGNDKPIYITGIYGVQGNAVTPVATAEIGDAAVNVCNALETYRINFDSAIYPDSTKAPAKVTYDVEGTATEVEGVTYTYGTNYVDLHLPTLANETTYTVSIPENTILSYYSGGTAAYVAATNFTFTTKEDICGSATPVLKMSYPKAGATALADTGFAAKLVAPNSTITAVKFYNGETEIAGTVTAGTDGEYWLTPDAAVLTAGVATEITAKAVDAEGNVLATASATYTGATTPSYYVEGIGDGDVIVKTHEASRKIKVIDSAWKGWVKNYVTNVSKIEIYNNDALLDTLVGEYEYELTFGETVDNKLEVKVYDVFGGVHSFVSNYKVLSGLKIPSESYELTFDNLEGTPTSADLAALFTGGEYGSTVSFSLVTLNGSNALKIENANGGAREIPIKTAKYNTGHKVHYYEFDITPVSHSYSNSFGVRPKGVSAGTTDGLFGTADYDSPKDTTGRSRAFYQGYTQKVRIAFDYNYAEGNAPTAIIWRNGDELKRVDLANTLAANFYNPTFVLGMNTNNCALQLDNIKYSVYDVAPEYAVKGIYEGATMVKEEEATRTITVVDKANANVVSTAATKISKVEFYKDDVLAATDEDGAPYTYALANDSYGAHKLEVKVYDTFNQEHSFVYNYNVVEGIKNTELSIDEDFEDFESTAASADLAAAIVGGNGTNITDRLTLSLATLNGSQALMVDGDDQNKAAYLQLGGDVSGKERKVYYYEFDVNMTTAYSRDFSVRGKAYNENPSVTLLTNKNTPGTNKVKIIVDYNDVAPTATIYVGGAEKTRVSLTDAVTVGEDGKVISPVLSMYFQTHSGGAPVYIDNFKYSVYDYPARFGKGDYDANAAFETVYTKDDEGNYTDTVYYHIATATTRFTNTTDKAVTVRNFFVVYDEEGRVLHVYQKDHSGWKEGNDDKTLTVTYQPGAIDQETSYRCHVAIPEASSGKFFTYVIGEDGAIDFAPIADFE